MKKINVIAAAFSLAALVASPLVFAQTYPTKPIRVIVPFAPGGSTDIISRLVTQRMAQELGQPVVVENKAGAGGAIGAGEGARAAPDGYTLSVATVSTMAVLPACRPKDLPYDPIKDFEPVALIATNLFVMSVPKDSPVRSVSDLVKLSQAEPGKYDYASSGNGTTSHLAAALFVSMSGAKLTHIPYKSNVPGLTDLVAGRVAMMFDNITAMQSQINAGTIRPIATTGLKRNVVLKDVPTLDESGIKGYDIRGWFCMLAPAGTPVEIVTKLNRELVRIVAMPEVTEKLVAIGADPETGSPQDLKALIASEILKYKNIIEIAGAKVE